MGWLSGIENMGCLLLDCHKKITFVLLFTYTSDPVGAVVREFWVFCEVSR